MKKEDIIAAVDEFMLEADYMTSYAYLDEKYSYSRARKRLKDLMKELKSDSQI